MEAQVQKWPQLMRGSTVQMLFGALSLVIAAQSAPQTLPVLDDDQVTYGVRIPRQMPSPLSDPLPSPSELQSALTADRYSADCQGPGPGEGCPPINIYRVVTQSEYCRRIGRSPQPSQARRATRHQVFCRFESAVATANQRTNLVWQIDEARLSLEPDSLTCLADRSRPSSLCRLHWRVD